ncbi:YncE family protein [Streptomyces sp. NPDC127084]|uniref:YncE family protein n=1 Tax=Streptomyces sp. NPDC127084 TaxID=3347133 RepID=UPI0036643362
MTNLHGAGLATAVGLALSPVAAPSAAAVPTGTYAYVANALSDTVSVIDTATTTIPVGDRPEGVAITPDGNAVYVTNANGDGDGDTVWVIDTATDTVNVGDTPAGVAVGLVPAAAAPVLTISKSHADNFRRGQEGARYHLTVSTEATAGLAEGRQGDPVVGESGTELLGALVGSGVVVHVGAHLSVRCVTNPPHSGVKGPTVEGDSVPVRERRAHGVLLDSARESPGTERPGGAPGGERCHDARTSASR